MEKDYRCICGGRIFARHELRVTCKDRRSFPLMDAEVLCCVGRSIGRGLCFSEWVMYVGMTKKLIEKWPGIYPLSSVGAKDLIDDVVADSLKNNDSEDALPYHLVKEEDRV